MSFNFDNSCMRKFIIRCKSFNINDRYKYIWIKDTIENYRLILES